VRSRGQGFNPAYEQENFLERVAAIYAEIERPYLVRVGAEGAPAEVHASVVRALAPWIPAFGAQAPRS
jgi:thymidylate kinase